MYPGDPGVRVQVGKDEVTYSLETPQGVQVVRVWTGAKTPRVMMFLEGRDPVPFSLFLDQLLAFGEDALAQVGRGPTTNSPPKPSLVSRKGNLQ